MWRVERAGFKGGCGDKILSELVKCWLGSDFS
jgi:hypothetical protein